MELVLPLIVERLGDVNARCSSAAKDALLFHWPGVAEDRLRAPFSSTQGSSLFFFQSLLDDSPNVAWY